MGPWLPALLCLGLCLGQKTDLTNMTLPIPQIILENGSVIIAGHSVSIRCRGPAEAQLFYLQREKADDFVDVQKPIWNEVLFFLREMTETLAGIYSCFYAAGAYMSPPSERVNLAVAGYRLKPYLSAKPGSKVAPGKALSFKCWSDQKFDRLIVYQDRGFIPPMYRLAPDWEIELSFSKVSAKHEGIYSCIGFVSTEPLMWSLPSNPILLTVSQSQDHTMDIGLLVLLALGTLLS